MYKICWTLGCENCNHFNASPVTITFFYTLDYQIVVLLLVYGFNIWVHLCVVYNVVP